LEVLKPVHSVTVYAKIGPELTEWLRMKGVAADDWLRYCVRDTTPELDARCAKHADELRESAVASVVLNSPIFVVEIYGFESMDKADLFIERRRLFPTSRPKVFAGSELIARFMSSWFELIYPDGA
jgi:DUF1365 family protein